MALGTVKKITAVLLSALYMCLAGCAQRPDTPDEDAISQQELPSVATQVDTEKSAPPPREKISRVTLLAAGDNLIHDVIYKQARTRTSDGSYDFKPIYERVKKQIAAADIAMINQETPIVKENPPSSYPLFNTPVEMAANLRDIGFDVLSISNNHMIDQRADGLASTAALIRATKGLTVTGVYDMPELRDQTVTVEKNGIQFAFLGFTQYTNGLAFPEGREYMAVYTDDADEMRRQITRAREKADVVVVSVHWGEEDTGSPTAYQRRVAQNLAEYGADIIIGTHPHVLQPVEIIETTQGKQVPVVYSLGNFVSAQSKSSNMVGAMAEIIVEKNQTTGKVTVGRPAVTPTVTHYGAGMWDVSIYPLSDYTEQLAVSHGVRVSYGKPFGMAWIQQDIAKVIAPEFIVPELRKAISAAGSSDTAKPAAQEASKPPAVSSAAKAPLGSPESPYAIEPLDPDVSSKAVQGKPAVSSKNPVVSSKKTSSSSEEQRLLPKRSDNAA